MKNYVLILSLLLMSGIAALLNIYYPYINNNSKFDSITVVFSDSQGLMDDGRVKVHINGMVKNKGDKCVENVKITLILMDEYNGILLMKPIKCQNHLSPNDSIEINSEYFTNAPPKTTIKTDKLKIENTARIKIEWIEDGVYKAKIIPPISSLVSSTNMTPNKDTKNSITTKSVQQTTFFENITSNTGSITYELIPQLRGNYEVIYVFKENGDAIACGDKLFYNVSSQNPIRFNIPQHNLTVESYIEIYSLGGDLLHSFKWRIAPSNYTSN